MNRHPQKSQHQQQRPVKSVGMLPGTAGAYWLNCTVAGEAGGTVSKDTVLEVTMRSANLTVAVLLTVAPDPVAGHKVVSDSAASDSAA